MEARRRVAAEKDRQIEATFEAALESVSLVRCRPGYADAMMRLLDEACPDGRTPSSVAVNAADVELVSQLLADRTIGAPVSAVPSVSAGIVVFSDGDRVKHDNSAEARLARLREAARESVSEMLFG
jgi:vacuolar-type H+-ATPase subunit E/Vma4